jgi:predicted dehydrogenase
MVNRGELGRIYHLEGAYHYGRLHKLTQGWRGRIKGYSVVLGGAVHLVDVLLWITGQRVTEVACVGNGISSAGSQFGGDDLAAALLRFADGSTATVTADYACVRPHGHGLTICGTQGTFVNGHPSGWLYRSRDPDHSPEPVNEPHPGADKGDLIAAFVDSILEDRDAEVTADDVFAALSVCFSIERAKREGTTVPVEYI